MWLTVSDTQTHCHWVIILFSLSLSLFSCSCSLVFWFSFRWLAIFTPINCNLCVIPLPFLQLRIQIHKLWWKAVHSMLRVLMAIYESIYLLCNVHLVWFGLSMHCNDYEFSTIKMVKSSGNGVVCHHYHWMKRKCHIKYKEYHVM